MSFFETVPLHETARERYLNYALSVITSRALPDLRDGLKPVQRRILYAMHTGLRLLPDGRFRKSATIVGECFVAGTRVSTPTGLVPIERLEVGDEVFTQTGVRRVTQCYIMPPQPLLRVELRGGRAVTCTPGQAFKVLQEDLSLAWRDASALKPGDTVVCRSAVPEAASLAVVGGFVLDEDLAYLLGFFLADGWVARDRVRGYLRLAFAAADRPVIERVQSIVRDRLGYDAAISERKGLFHLRVHDSNLSRRLLEAFGLADKRAANIRVPEAMFASPPRVIAAFASGFTDGDGTVHRSRRLIALTSIAEPFLRDLQTLLHSLGVHARLVANSRHESPSRYATGWALEVTGHSFVELARRLCLSVPRKQARLDACLATRHRFTTEDARRIPHLGRHLVETFRERHLGGGWYVAPDGRKVRAGLHYGSGAKLRYVAGLADTLELSFPQLESLGMMRKLDALGLPLAARLRDWMEQGVGFAEVVRIEAAPAEVTYDVQVEEDHEFIANGMLVHNCMGKYHPHGDSAIYEAMVRMAQPFALRAPLVDGQGNFGSIDGDNAAAMRYTEAKLRPLAVELLDELKRQTVAWRPTFDGTLSEPVVLPARFPNLLVNGATGIAVGMATNIPSHALGEVIDALDLLIRRPKATLEEVMEVLPGPDFPTGGRLLATRAELTEMYRKGEGGFDLQGTWTMEGKQHVILTSIPYGVDKASLVEKIADLIVAEKLPQLSDIRDESTDTIRVVLELRRGADVDAAMAYLLRHTPLQTRFHANLTCLVPTEREDLAAPQRCDLLTLLRGFLAFRLDVVTRRLRFDLEGLERRIHLLEGFEKIFGVLDECLKIIRASKDKGDAAQRLMHRFGIDDEQTDAILELKLYRLARLEIEVIEKELAERRAAAEELRRLLSEEGLRWKLVLTELRDIRKRYADARRTEIALPAPVKVYNAEDYIVAEDVFVIVTRDGWVKRQRSYTEVGAIRVREGDSVGWVLGASTRATVAFLTSAGKAYTVRVETLASTTGYGEPIQKIFEFADREQVVGVVSYDARVLPDGVPEPAVVGSTLFEGDGAPSAAIGPFVVAVSRMGQGVRIPAEAFLEPSNRNGRTLMRLDGKDAVVMADVAGGAENVCMASKSGHVLIFPALQIPLVKGAAKGVIAMRLGTGDAVLGATLSSGRRDGLEVETSRGRREIVRTTKFEVQNRGLRGKPVLQRGGFIRVIAEPVVRGFDEA